MNTTKSAGKPTVHVAIDDGFGQIKLLGSDGQRRAQISVARPGFTLGDAMDGRGRESGAYETGGRQWTVDPDVEGEDTRYDGYDVSDINRVLVHHALYSAGYGGVSVRLATGLPFSSYYQVGTATSDQARIRAKMTHLAMSVESMDGAAAPVIAEQQVYPQGVMAFLDHVLDDALQWRAGFDPSAPAVVVDIGGRTTDTATVVRGSTIDHAASGTATIGVAAVHDDVLAGIKARFGLSGGIRRARLDRCVRERVVNLRGQPHDIGEIIDAAVEKVADAVVREVGRRVGDAAEMQTVLLVGGGASLFAPALRRRYPHLQVAQDPEFANARGMLKAMGRGG